MLRFETPQKPKNLEKLKIHNQFHPNFTNLTNQTEKINDEKKIPEEPGSPFFKLEDILSPSDNNGSSPVIDFSPTFSTIGEEGPKNEKIYKFAIPSTLSTIKDQININKASNQYFENKNILYQNRNLNEFLDKKGNKNGNKEKEDNFNNKSRTLSFEIQSTDYEPISNDKKMKFSNIPYSKSSFLKIEEVKILEKKAKVLEDELKLTLKNKELIENALNSSRINLIISFLEYLKDKNDFYYYRKLLNFASTV